LKRFFPLMLAVSLLSSVAQAAPEDDAKDLFARGRELRAKGDCGSAVSLFAKAYELYPKGLGSLRNLAECQEQLGRPASARRAWLDLSRALLTTTDPKYAGWSDDAHAADARLAPKVARLTVQVHSTTSVPLRVFVNGELLDPKLIDVALERDPATYLVRVEGGREPMEKSVTIGSGEARTVTFDIAVAPAVAEKAPAPKTAEAPASSLRTYGIVALAVGGGAAAAASISFVVRQNALGDLRDTCPSYESKPCPESARSIVDRGSTASTLVTVFSAMAVVGIGTGVTLLLMGPSDSPKASVALAPWAGPSVGGASLQGSF